ncbi:helix-turn-helix domain-containing protein [Caulobacter segnis]|uniref:Transcriptional regulator, MarR family n=1 Tax=Caulobacter segnis (strain ATCC 21756 / DSM 7131 / JCM 7823 / NBRC 15250 / LMG 17158 / TK0059) TaxID=509190 RepID=D5VKL5_CAUST|nr:MarR family winged helix-turn-helix transcriptional regulator [Caulobacter segnis]ADG11038.1 transcriptional regulator, MarR family [Caulobacter segnis ATCC 21756]
MTREAARAFDYIASGDASPAEALAVIREAGDMAGKAYGQRVYIALKAVTVRRLTSRRADDASAWIDVIRQSSALLKARGETLVGERLLVLSDMAADWARTCKVHDIKSLLERPHVLSILQALHEAGGRAKRADLARQLGIGDANFSRILGALEAVGLILRDRRKERTIGLTEEGARLAAERFGLLSQIKPVGAALVGRSVESVLKDVKRLVKDHGHQIATYEPTTHSIHFYGGDTSVFDGYSLRCEVHKSLDYVQADKRPVYFAGGVVASRNLVIARDPVSGVLGGKPTVTEKASGKGRSRGRD